MIKNAVFDFGQVLVHFDPAYMVGQILAKSMPSKQVLSVLTEIAPDLPYMAIARDTYLFLASLFISIF